MAFTTPRTWSTGEIVTASTMNTDHRDNISFLYNAPSCRVYNSAAISIPNASETFPTFDTERFDNDTIHSTTTNTGRLTCRTAGVYIISGHLRWASNNTGWRYVEIRVNGTLLVAVVRVTAVQNDTTEMSVAAQYKLAVGDYAQLGVFQTTGAALNVDAVPAESPEFGMTWVSAG